MSGRDFCCEVIDHPCLFSSCRPQLEGGSLASFGAVFRRLPEGYHLGFILFLSGGGGGGTRSSLLVGLL